MPNLCFNVTVRVYADSPEHLARLIESARDDLGDAFDDYTDINDAAMVAYANNECSTDHTNWLADKINEPGSGLTVRFDAIEGDYAKIEEN